MTVFIKIHKLKINMHNKKGVSLWKINKKQIQRKQKHLMKSNA